MARVGRPRKNLTPIEKEKIELSDDILNVVKYNAKLNDSQTDVLRKALEEAFQSALFLPDYPEIANKIRKSHSAHEAQKIMFENEDKVNYSDKEKIEIMEKLLKRNNV